MARKQERVGIARAGQRLEERSRGLAERHRARAGLRIGESDGVPTSVAPAQIEHFAAPAACERQQPDRRNDLGPARFVGVERAPEPGQLVGVEKPGDLLPRDSSQCRDKDWWRARKRHSSARLTTRNAKINESSLPHRMSYTMAVSGDEAVQAVVPIARNASWPGP